MKRSADRTAIEELRLIVQNFSFCTETFNEQWSTEQLIAIGRAHLDSGWDIFPDYWTRRQVREALKGIKPQWDDNERPVYTQGGHDDRT